jgi:hypothetical protein
VYFPDSWRLMTKPSLMKESKHTGNLCLTDLTVHASCTQLEPCIVVLFTVKENFCRPSYLY